MAVADNSNTPLEALNRLAADESPDVRYRLAENHNSPEEVLRLLVDDPNPYVVISEDSTGSLETTAR